KILHFQSDIELGADGVVQVRETIRLTIGGVKFDDGFRRDFPLVRRGLYERRRYGLVVEGALRDGSKDEVLVNTEEVPDYARVSIGDYAVPLWNGEHTYTVNYKRTGHVRFGPDYDELVLDVTGTGWAVPIEKVSVTVALPQGARPLTDRVAGVIGAGAKDCAWKELPGGKVSFEATRPLRPGESLAIAVPLAKGAVAEPSAAEKRRTWVRENLPAVIALGGFVAVVAFLVVAWVLFGGWPLGPAAQPRAEPPVDPDSGRTLSPAEVACVHNMGFDESCVAPALLDMGVRGYLTIEQKKAEGGEQYVLHRRTEGDRSSLTPDEQRFAEQVFGSTRSSLMLKADDQNLFRAVKAMREPMEKEWGRNTFRGHALLRALGWALAAAATVAAAVCRLDSDPQALWILLAAVSAPTLVLVCYGVRHLFRERRKLATNDPKKPSQIGYLLDVLAIGIGSTALIAWLYWLSHYSTIWVPLGVFGMWLANATVGPHLRRYTRRGRLVMHQAKQLALHMTTKLSDTAPRPTGPEPFESLLPYAMALGIANRWATNFFARFGQEVAVAAMQPGESHGTSLKPYVPLWFRAEQAWDWIGDRRYTVFAELQHRLRKNLPSGRAAAATSSSGSSSRRRATVAASGARGYSGGGSGGGGGKGW
ncbi:MAG: DUF2207 domain-containing protein, partial [Planctomycetes bacterium]|nr:DUF2207 domain-containing protein [Planctomycetota bacterium]